MISLKLRNGRVGLDLLLSGGLSGLAPMLAPLLGYFFCMITVFTAVAVVLTGFVNISPSRTESHHLRPPVIGRTVMVETQRLSPPAAKEASLAKDVSPVVATATADAKASKPHKPKLLARQRNNYERPGYYGTALGYAQESRNGPQRLFVNW